MKILLVIDSLGSGGAQRQLVNLGIGFKELGHDVSFLIYHDYNFFTHELYNFKIPVHKIIEPSYFKRLFRIRRFIRNHKPNAVLSFLDGANFISEFASLPLKSWKLIVGERSANPAIKKSPKLIFYKWFHLFSQHVVSNSKQNLDIIYEVCPLLKMKKNDVIYNIIDFNIWNNKNSVINLDKGKFNLIIVASHHRLKNLNNLIEAVFLLDENNKNKLRIQWYGDERDDSLKSGIVKISQYNLKDIFSFYPATTDIVTKVKNADALGLFSFYEGLPNVVCEGMASGKPIICSNVSDVKYFLGNQIELLFDPYNIDSILDSLNKLLALSNIELSEIGKINNINAYNFFDKQTIINSYLTLMK
jgi:glycosyltransferase involved in cell wall biosynthesis